MYIQNHPHPHTYIYVYMHKYVCVCYGVCVLRSLIMSNTTFTVLNVRFTILNNVKNKNKKKTKQK